MLTYRLREQTGYAALQSEAAHRLELYAATLQSELSGYDYLAGILSLDDKLIGLLEQPQDPLRVDAINRHLERVNALAGTSALYLMDTIGNVLAASNWRDTDSLVGNNFAYRPYFEAARGNAHGRFYGIGSSSREPGYYMASGIRRGGSLRGVLAVRAQLDELARTWTHSGEHVLLADHNRVVVLASEPSWRYRTLAPLPAGERARLRATAQYLDKPLEPLGLVTVERFGPRSRVVDLPGEGRHFSHALPVAGTQWHLLLLADAAPVAESARHAAAMAALLAGVLTLLGLYLRQRRRAGLQRRAVTRQLQRAHAELERRVEERTAELSGANAQLQREIAERRRAEQVLNDAQEELVQAAKMAALGQMAAGVTQELNQPLTALRTLSDSARESLRHGHTADAEGKLAAIANLTERMGRITAQLKGFARKSSGTAEPVVVQRALANTLLLLEARLRRERIEVERDWPEHEALALCDGNRLEQVLLNLIGNALDAMDGAPVRQLHLGVREETGRVLICVRDSGAGLSGEAAEQLFEPFYTGKPQSQGLGLGLPISAQIVRGFGGVLRGYNAEQGGAEFVVELPAAR